jgi:hypothetical protein
MIRRGVCESVLLMTVAGLALGTFCGAVAAGETLPSRGAKPRADRCVALHGPGFVAVEGTDACIKVGGHIRVDTGVSSRARSTPWRGGSLGSGVATSAGVDVETRADTDIGPVRGVLRLRGGMPGVNDPFFR